MASQFQGQSASADVYREDVESFSGPQAPTASADRFQRTGATLGQLLAIYAYITYTMLTLLIKVHLGITKRFLQLSYLLLTLSSFPLRFVLEKSEQLS